MFDITPGTLFIYYCGYEQCLPGHAFGPAVRPHYLIHLVLNGCGIYKCGNETYTLNAGDAFLISPVNPRFIRRTTAGHGNMPGSVLTAPKSKISLRRPAFVIPVFGAAAPAHPLIITPRTCCFRWCAVSTNRITARLP